MEYPLAFLDPLDPLTCHVVLVQMYLAAESKLAPEVVRFTTEDGDAHAAHGELFVDSGADHNLLRPETVESLMILHRVTGDPIYRQHGRTIMKAFETNSRVRLHRVAWR